MLPTQYFLFLELLKLLSNLLLSKQRTAFASITPFLKYSSTVLLIPNSNSHLIDQIFLKLSN